MTGKNGALERIRKAVMTWEGVESQPHRFGGVEFRYGKREIGHIHGDFLVDIPFPIKERNELIESRRAEPHHILPSSGWVSCYIKNEDDINTAIELLELSLRLARIIKTDSTAGH